MKQHKDADFECQCGAKFTYKFGWHYIYEDEQILIPFGEDASNCCREKLHHEQTK